MLGNKCNCHWQTARASLANIIQYFILVVKVVQNTDLLREVFFILCGILVELSVGR